MSVHEMEVVLHQVSTDRNARSEFRKGADEFLRKFNLTDAERQAVAGFNVRQMQAAGVSALLTYGFWLTAAKENNRGAYLQALAPTKE